MKLPVAAFLALALSVPTSLLAQEQVVTDPSRSMTASNQKIEVSWL